MFIFFLFSENIRITEDDAKVTTHNVLPHSKYRFIIKHKIKVTHSLTS